MQRDPCDRPLFVEESVVFLFDLLKASVGILELNETGPDRVNKRVDWHDGHA
jgi:hypothetical protein